MSGTVSMVNDAKKRTAMASESKEPTMTNLRIMEGVCDDTSKASACLTTASALVDVLGDDKLRLRKSTKFGAKVRLFLDGIDQEATTDALQHAFFKFGQVMWLKQDDIDDQLEIDVAHKRRKLIARNSIGDLNSTCTFI